MSDASIEPATLADPAMTQTDATETLIRNGSLRRVHSLSPLARSSPQEMATELCDQGWCFVRCEWPPEQASLVEQLQNFFAQNEEDKALHRAPRGYGYSCTEHKEALRFLTGQRLLSMDRWVPPAIHSSLFRLARWIDRLAIDVTKSLCGVVFGEPSEVARRADLPVSFERQFGLLDVALYRNHRAGIAAPMMGVDVREVNCVPHHDPGLLSFSLYSSHEGLQMRDPRTEECG